MNKFQRRESRMIKRMHNDIDLIGMPFNFDHYKAFRRGLRKTTRMLLKANKEAYKNAITGIDLANGSDQTAYVSPRFIQCHLHYQANRGEK